MMSASYQLLFQKKLPTVHLLSATQNLNLHGPICSQKNVLRECTGNDSSKKRGKSTGNVQLKCQSDRRRSSKSGRCRVLSLG
ncbi:hypothetical protein BRADI_1g78305v3 [Brachypodium distachyon]|uniref:Uncharacterized protein n=1 Tax=Brachypodium distachyon TaxID=15368 RepID=A0A2K2DVT0_BRADI|nr:hypothetical protein BRADI_1g78305v3 [Brachypodium distachyon]